MNRFVLVRVYADGSRVRIGPLMSLDDAWGCLCWWNYFDNWRYEAESVGGDDFQAWRQLS